MPEMGDMIPVHHFLNRETSIMSPYFHVPLFFLIRFDKNRGDW